MTISSSLQELTRMRITAQVLCVWERSWKIMSMSHIEGVWKTEEKPTRLGIISPSRSTTREMKTYKSKEWHLLIWASELLTEQKSINRQRWRFRCTQLGLSLSLCASRPAFRPRGSDVWVWIRANYDKPGANFVHADFSCLIVALYWDFYRMREIVVLKIWGFEFLSMVVHFYYQAGLNFRWPSAQR